MGKDEFLRSRREREKGGGELLHPCVLMAKKEKEKGIGSNLFEIKDIYTELLLFPVFECEIESRQDRLATKAADGKRFMALISSHKN